MGAEQVLHQPCDILASWEESPFYVPISQEARWPTPGGTDHMGGGLLVARRMVSTSGRRRYSRAGHALLAAHAASCGGSPEPFRPGWRYLQSRLQKVSNRFPNDRDLAFPANNLFLA